MTLKLSMKHLLSNPASRLALFLSGVALLCYWSAPAHTQVVSTRFFFVDSELGRDSAPGTSTRWPWRTINRVNQGLYRAGDTILFRAGQRFEGSLSFTSRNAAGSSDSPVIISSYGDGRATIVSGKAHGLSASDVGGLHITGINFEGAVPDDGNAIGVYFNIAGNPKTPSVQIDHVDITGYLMGSLISVQRPGLLDGLSLRNLEIHDNRWAGVVITGQDPSPPTQSAGADPGQPNPTPTPSPTPFPYALRNVVVQAVHSYNNQGLPQQRFDLPESRGTGIYAANAERVMVKDCKVENNGGPPPDSAPDEKQPIVTMFGMTVTGRALVVDSNETTSQRVASKSGWGGGVRVLSSEALVQYNYVHDNDGLGLRVETRPSQANQDPAPKVAVRYNIIQSEAGHAGLGALSIAGSTTELDLYNNTVASIADINPAKADDPLPNVPVLTIEAATPDASVVLRGLNNIFASRNSVPVLLVSTLPANSDVRVEGNAYVDPSGSYSVQWGNDSYQQTAANLAMWLAGVNLEMLGRAFVLRSDSPLPLVLSAPDGKPPAKLTDLQTYLLVDGSPLLNTGLNVSAAIVEHRASVPTNTHISPNPTIRFVHFGGGVIFLGVGASPPPACPQQ